jgi:hypothetical protein
LWFLAKPDGGGRANVLARQIQNTKKDMLLVVPFVNYR